MAFNTISVVGLGYIGLPTAAMFASKKKQVIGVDVNKFAVDTINAGGVHIVEPELDAIVKTAVTEGYLRAVTTPEPADAFLVAVPTPFLLSDLEDSAPEPDLRFIEMAARAIAKVIKKGDLVVLESTSPVGATDQMASWLSNERNDLTFPQTHGMESDIRVAYCPERVLPGHVVRELVENDRVIGGMTERCSADAIELYSLFVEGECVVTNARSAEMAKLTENAFRDVSIAFANELSIICDKLEIDVWELIQIANRHPRVNVLQPGPGVGGHCIAVDPWFIVSTATEEARLIKTARNVNDSKPDWVLNKIEQVVNQYLSANKEVLREAVVIACYGLAFKPNIDDLRESPALHIVQELSHQHPGIVVAVEPNINELPETTGGFKLVTLSQAMAMADVHVLLVDHSQFRIEGMKSLVGKPVVDAVGYMNRYWSDFVNE